MKNYNPERLAAISRYQDYFPALSIESISSFGRSFSVPGNETRKL